MNVEYFKAIKYLQSLCTIVDIISNFYETMANYNIDSSFETIFGNLNLNQNQTQNDADNTHNSTRESPRTQNEEKLVATDERVTSDDLINNYIERNSQLTEDELIVADKRIRVLQHYATNEKKHLDSERDRYSKALYVENAPPELRKFLHGKLEQLTKEGILMLENIQQARGLVILHMRDEKRDRIRTELKQNVFKEDRDLIQVNAAVVNNSPLLLPTTSASMTIHPDYSTRVDIVNSQIVEDLQNFTSDKNLIYRTMKFLENAEGANGITMGDYTELDTTLIKFITTMDFEIPINYTSVYTDLYRNLERYFIYTQGITITPEITLRYNLLIENNLMQLEKAGLYVGSIAVKEHLSLEMPLTSYPHINMQGGHTLRLPTFFNRMVWRLEDTGPATGTTWSKNLQGETKQYKEFDLWLMYKKTPEAKEALKRNFVLFKKLLRDDPTIIKYIIAEERPTKYLPTKHLHGDTAGAVSADATNEAPIQLQEPEAPKSMKKANVIYQDQTEYKISQPVSGKMYVGTKWADEISMPEGKHSLTGLMTRPLQFDTIEWSESDARHTVIATYSIPNIYYTITDTINISMLEQCMFYHSDMILEFRVNTTKMHQGGIYIYEIPLGQRELMKDADPDKPWRPSVHPYNTILLNGIWIDAQKSNTCQLIIPYKHICTYLDIARDARGAGTQNKYIYSIGTVNVQVMIPLAASTNASPKVDISVFVHAVNSVMHYPVPKHIIQGIADTAVKGAIAYETGNVPAMIQAGVELVGEVGGMTDQVMDDPLIYSADTKPWGNLYTGCGGKVTQKVTLSPLAVTKHPSEIIGDPELDLRKLMKRPSIIATFDYRAEAAPGTQLFTIPITPMLGMLGGALNHGAIPWHPTNLSALTAPGAMWKGSVVYTFMFFCTGFHKGRLAISTMYGGDHKRDSTLDFKSSLTLSRTIIDIGKENTFRHVVPYLSSTPWKKVSRIPYFHLGKIPNVDDDLRYEDTLGNIYVHVVNRLAVTNTIPSQISVLVMMSAGEDYEIHYLNQLSPRSQIWPYKALQGLKGRGGNTRDIKADNKAKLQQDFLGGNKTLPMPTGEETDPIVERLTIQAPIQGSYGNVKAGHEYYSGEAWYDLSAIMSRPSPLYSDLFSKGDKDKNNGAKTTHIPNTPMTAKYTAYHYSPDEQWDTSHSSLLGYYSELFTGYRGCIGYRVLTTAAVTNNGMLFVSYHPFGDFFTGLTNPAARQWPYIHDAVDLQQYSANAHAYTGQAMTYLGKDPSCTFSFPYVTINSFTLMHSDVRNADGDMSVEMALRSGTGIICATFTDRGTKDTEYMGAYWYHFAMDDYHPFGYLGPIQRLTPLHNFSLEEQTFYISEPKLISQTIIKDLSETKRDNIKDIKMQLQRAGIEQNPGPSLSKHLHGKTGIIAKGKAALDSMNIAADTMTEYFTNPVVESIPEKVAEAADGIKIVSSKMESISDDIGGITGMIKSIFTGDSDETNYNEIIRDLRFKVPEHAMSIIIKIGIFARQQTWFDRFLILLDFLLQMKIIKDHYQLAYQAITRCVARSQVPNGIVKDLQGDGDETCAADTIAGITSAIVTLGGIIGLSALPKDSQISKGVGKFSGKMREISFISQGVRGSMYLFEEMVKLTKKIVEWFVGENCPELRASKLLEENADAFMAFITEVSELNKDETRLAMTRDKILRYKIMKIRLEADRLQALVNKIPYNRDCNLHMYFSRSHSTIVSIYDEMMRTNLSVPSRKVPFCVWLGGPPDVGKSHCANALAMLMAKQLGAPADMCAVYARNLKEDFYSGYAGHPMMVVDEFCQMRGGNNTQYFDFITWISPMPMQVPMAKVEEKGRSFTSDGVIITSNLFMPAPPEIADHKALHRRRHVMAKVTMRDGYEKKVGCYDHLRVDILNRYNENEVMISDMTWEDFVFYTLDKFEEHTTTQEQLVEGLQSDVDAMWANNEARKERAWLMTLTQEQRDLMNAGELHLTRPKKLHGIEGLEKGDLIRFNRGRYFHWGVYVGDEEGEQMCVHLTEDYTKATTKSGIIAKERISDVRITFGDYCLCPVDIVNQDFNATGRGLIAKTPTEIVASCMKDIGEIVPYDVLTNNCEHYATRQRYGVGWCSQVERMIYPIIKWEQGDILTELKAVEEIEGTSAINIYTNIRQAIRDAYEATSTKTKKVYYLVTDDMIYYLQMIKDMIPNLNLKTLPGLRQAMTIFTDKQDQIMEYSIKHNIPYRDIIMDFRHLLQNYKTYFDDMKNDEGAYFINFCDERCKKSIIMYNEIFEATYVFTKDEYDIIHNTIYNADKINYKWHEMVYQQVVAVKAHIWKETYVKKAEPFLKRHPWIKPTLMTLAGIIAAITMYVGIKTVMKFTGRKDKVQERKQKYQQEGAYNTGETRKIGMRLNPEVRIVTKRPIPTTRKLEGVIDPNATDIVEHVWKPAMFRFIVRREGRAVYQQNAVMIEGKLAIVNAHAMAHIEDEDILEYVFPHSGCTFSEEYDPEAWAIYEDSDIAMWEMSANMPSARTIWDRFVTEKDLEYVDNLQAAIISTQTGKGTNSETIRMRIQTEPVAADDNKSTLVLAKSWNYRCVSYPGLCGAGLIIMNPRSPRKIAGLHAIGETGTTDSNGVIVTQEMLIELRKEFKKQVIQEDKVLDLQGEVAQVEIEGNFTRVGIFKPNEVPRSATRTRIRKSPLHGIFPVQTFPSVLYQKDKRNKSGKDPLGTSISKYGVPARNFNMKIFRQAEQEVTRVIMQCKPLRRGPELTIEQAINGIPEIKYYDPIDMKTSPGYPYVMSRPHDASGKEFLFEKEGDIWKMKNDDLIRRVKNRIELGEQGYVPYDSLWTVHPKDERKPWAKIEAAKTRTFISAPVDYTIVARKFFLDFTAAFYSEHGKFFSAVGIDMFSSEWGSLFNRLVEMSPTGIFGDYENFDGKALAMCIASSFRSIQKWYEKYYPEWNHLEREKQVRVLMEEIIHTKMIIRNLLVVKHQGMPSGCTLTALVNSMIGALYLRYFFLLLALGHDVEYASMTAYNLCVRDVVYGDDNIVPVKEKIQHWFNQHTLTEAMGRYGIVYTHADKISNPPPITAVRDMTFLKCGFREEKKKIHATIAERTITELCNWITDGGSKEKQMEANLKDALGFAYHYGKTYFNDMLNYINDYLEYFGYPTLDVQFQDHERRFYNTFV